MLVIWRGWGILVIPIVVLTGVPVVVILDLVVGGLDLPDWTGSLTAALGLFAAAAAVWQVGKRFTGGRGREFIRADQTARRVEIAALTVFHPDGVLGDTVDAAGIVGLRAPYFWHRGPRARIDIQDSQTG